MTELKTLKDLNIYGLTKDGYRVRSDGELKQEAIKWIRKFEKDLEIAKNLGIKAAIGSSIEFIKHFFNITESELENA